MSTTSDGKARVLADGSSGTSEYSDVEYTFGPHVASLPDLRNYLGALWERRTFIGWLARTDLRTDRTSTTLGNLWSILDPLFQAGIYFFVYMVLRGGARQDYLPVLIAQIFLFNLTTSALGEGGSSVKRGKGLMLSSTFPRALLPVTSVYKNLLSFVSSALVVVVVFPLVGGQIGAGVFLLPLLFLIQLVMNVGISLLVATLVVLVKDASNAMKYVTRVLFFTTPIIWPVALLPEGVKPFVSLQPLFSLFASYQAVFMGGTPSVGLIVMAAGWAAFFLVLGGRLFLRNERRFAMHL